MSRFFAVAKGFEDRGVNLPKRSTEFSAGYDIEALEDTVVPSVWKNYTDTLKRIPTHAYIETDDSELEGLFAPEYFTTLPSNQKRVFKPTLVATGIKANMEEDEVLYLYNRSSNPKKGLILANGVGVIDKDYFENPDNDGHFFFPFLNFGEEDYVIKKGDRVGQGVFSKYLMVNDDNATGKRNGGLGSTGV